MDKLNVLLRWDVLQSYFLIVLGAFYLLASFQLASDKYLCVSKGERLPGTIARLIETKENGKAATYPVIAYKTKEGKPREYRLDTPSDSYAAGAEVPLLVGPLPSCNVSIDKGILNYRLAMTMAALSFLMLLGGLRELPKHKKALRERLNK
jgi:hypothetical protein